MLLFNDANSIDVTVQQSIETNTHTNCLCYSHSIKAAKLLVSRQFILMCFGALFVAVLCVNYHGIVFNCRTKHTQTYTHIGK